MKGLRTLSIIAIIAALFAITISCDPETPVPQGYTTPTATGVIQVPDSSGLSPDDFYLYVRETGFQTKVLPDGSWVVQSLESGKGYSIYFQNAPFNDVSRDGSRSLTSTLYSAHKTGVYGATGQGADAGLIQIRQAAKATGTVVNRAGEPLENVTIHIPDTPYLTQSAADGSFTLDGLSDGVYEVVFEHSGYLGSTHSDLTVMTEENTSRRYDLGTVIMASVLGSIQGQVQFPGSTGTGGRSATVRAEKVDDRTVFRTSTTDSEGGFFLDALPAGSYTVTIEAGTSYETEVVENVEVSSSGTTFLSPITLTAIGGELWGHVTTNDGQNPQGAGILLESLSGSEKYFAEVDESGNYRIGNIIVGDYQLTVTLDGYGIIRDEIEIILGNNREHNFALEPVTGSITGRIVLDGATTNFGVSVTATYITDTSYSETVTTAENGTFTIRNLKREGNYQISIARDGYSSDVSRTATVTFGEMASIGTVTLKSLGATATGTVRLDGYSAHDGATIILETLGIQYDEVSDRSGDFFFAGLPAGTYTMTVSKDGFVTKTMESISIGQSESKDFGEIVLTQDIRPLTGYVELADTTDFSGVAVTAVNISDTQTTYSTETIVGGSYEIDGMKPGTYDVTFSKEGYISRTVRVVMAAGSPVTANVRLEAGTAVVSGYILLDGATGNAGATVTLTNINHKDEIYTTTILDKDGFFSFSDIRSEGSYQLTARADGYVTWNSDNLTITFGQALNIGEVRLSRLTGSIAGTITRENSGNHGEITVALSNGITTLETTTAATGSFEFTAVPAGIYSLTASATGYGTMTVGEVVVSQGSRTVVESIELPVTLQSITGTVTHDVLGVLEGALVTARPISGSGEEKYVHTDASGNYAILDLKPGTYTLIFTLEGFNTEETSVTITVGSSASADVQLEVSTAIVTGRILLDGAEDNAGATVTLTNLTHMGETYTAETNEDGSFTIGDIRMEGTFQLTVSADGYVTWNSDNLNITFGQALNIEEVMLSRLSGSITGTITREDSDNHGGIVVAISNGSISMNTETDATGSYEFTAVPAGTYSLTASVTGYEPRTLGEVVVEQSSRTELASIELPVSLQSITGTVTLEGLDDHSGVLVTASPISGSGTEKAALTSESGAYAFVDMTPGTYTLTFTYEGYRDYTTSLTLSVGSAASADARLELADGLVTGKVIISGSSDYAGVTVTLRNVSRPTITYQVETKADGYYEIAGVKYAGLYQVSASKAGYATSNSTSVTVDLEAVTNVEDITLMPLTATVSGKVELDGLSSHAGITVSLTQDGGDNSYETVTQGNGDFVFMEVVAGTYTLTASYENYVTRTISPLIIDQATDVVLDTIVLGQAILPLTGTVTVVGTRDYSDVAVTAVNIVDANTAYSTVTADDGSYEIEGMMPGTYDVTFSKDGYISYTTRVVMVANTQVTADGTLEVGTAGIVTGRIKLEGASDNAGVTVTLTNLTHTGDTYTAATSEDGSFTINEIRREGTYQLTAEADGYVTWNSETLTISFGQALRVEEVTLQRVTGSIVGTITRAGSSNHGGITVEISNGTMTRETTTDTDGAYEFTCVPAGIYSLTATATGYETKNLGDIVVEQGRRTYAEAVEIPVSLQSITGTVSLEGLGSIEGVQVAVRPISGSGEGKTVLTNASGYYAFEDMTPSTYTLTFTHEGYKDYSTNVTLGVGSAVSMDASLELEDGLVTGKIIIVGASDYSGVTVTIRNSSGRTYSAETEADGTYAITDVNYAGFYTLTASKDGHANVTMSVEVILSATTNVEDIMLNQLTATVSGKVELDGLSSHAGITVSLTQDGGDNSYETVTQGNGDFVFTQVVAGTYTLTASYENYVTRTISPVVVSQSNELSLDPIVLVKEVLPFSGIVTVDGVSALSGVTVTASSLEADGPVYSTTTGVDGAYSFSSMRVGEYELSFFLDGYEFVSTRITVVAGVSGSYNVTLKPGTGTITGRVLLEGTDDCSGITVTATRSDGQGASHSTTTATSDGTFMISGITEAGTYVVTASKDGFQTNNSISITVQLARAVSIGTITLKNYNADISGFVKLDDSRTYANVSVILQDEEGGNRKSTTTDAEGEYFFTDVIPERSYTVTATRGGSSKTSAAFYVPQSASIVVPDIILPHTTETVTGTVDIEGTDNEAGAVITAVNILDENLQYAAVSNSQGTFNLVDVEPGSYQIIVSKPSYKTVTLSGVEVGNTLVDLGTIELSIARGIVTGVARLEGRTDHSGTNVEIVDTAGYSAITNANGEYSLTVPSGVYAGGLRFTREDYDAVFLRDPVSITEDGTSVASDVELKCNAASIRGTVAILSNDDASGVTVAIEGTELSVVTGADGFFLFEHVPLGSYTISFSRENVGSAIKHITLEPVGVMDIGTTTLIPNAATITGIVRLDGMDDQSGVVITATPVNGGVSSSTESDAGGFFHIGNLDTEHDYTVTFSKEGWDSKSLGVSGLDPYEVREISPEGEVVLVDTTAPILSEVIINNGANTADDQLVTITIEATDSGSGLAMIQYWFDGVSDPIIEESTYAESFGVEFPAGDGEKTIYVKVIDKAGNVSSVGAANVTFVNSKTRVSGTLSGDDLHWTKNLSPYLVTGDIVVPSGETLIIDPGVDVQFDGAWYIHVVGTIQAVGTTDERIKFYGVNDGVGTWKGIRVESGSVASSLEYVDLIDAMYGIGGNATVSNAIIECNNSPGDFTGVMTGSELNMQMYSFRDAKLDTVVITGGGRNVGEISSLYSVLINCTVNDVGSISYDGNINYTVIFINCTIGDVGEVENSDFFNCKLSDVGKLSDSDFFYCTISDVERIRPYSIFSCIVKRVDSIVTYSNNKMNNCNLIDCMAFDVGTFRDWEETVDFRNNYWGEAWTAAFKESENGNVDFIYDGYDDFNRARLDYSGYFEKPIEGIGAIEGDPVIPTLPEGSSYSLGDCGPSGGTIVYVDEDGSYPAFDYIEAIDTNVYLPFCYHRLSDDSDNLMVGTSTEVGSGMSNTLALVEAMGDYAYTDSAGSSKGPYAARVAAEIGWAMPSSGDLELVNSTDFISFDWGWSSTESDATSVYYGENGFSRSKAGENNITLVRYY